METRRSGGVVEEEKEVEGKKRKRGKLRKKSLRKSEEEKWRGYIRFRGAVCLPAARARGCCHSQAVQVYTMRGVTVF